MTAIRTTSLSTGTMLASLSMVTLGALVISSAYRTGDIRTSLTAGHGSTGA
ncbi:hypothetical protein AB0J28_45870 [Streptosporangium canum]|uniref:hypothetical protein n=1 Tax=Streptosporangium canum TaxID=324952 RepID=UPI003415C6AB